MIPSSSNSWWQGRAFGNTICLLLSAKHESVLFTVDVMVIRRLQSLNGSFNLDVAEINVNVYIPPYVEVGANPVDTTFLTFCECSDAKMGLLRSYHLPASNKRLCFNRPVEIDSALQIENSTNISSSLNTYTQAIMIRRPPSLMDQSSILPKEQDSSHPPTSSMPLQRHETPPALIKRRSTAKMLQDSLPEPQHDCAAHPQQQQHSSSLVEALAAAWSQDAGVSPIHRVKLLLQVQKTQEDITKSPVLRRRSTPTVDYAACLASPTDESFQKHGLPHLTAINFLRLAAVTAPLPLMETTPSLATTTTKHHPLQRRRTSLLLDMEQEEERRRHLHDWSQNPAVTPSSVLHSFGF